MLKVPTLGSEGGRGRWRTPTMAQNIRIQQRNLRQPPPFCDMVARSSAVSILNVEESDWEEGRCLWFIRLNTIRHH